jgi:hypothetical protein
MKIRTLTKENLSHYYTNDIESGWTPIEPIIKNVMLIRPNHLS